MSEACSNPICGNPIEPETENRWRRTPRKFCCDGCKHDAWAIRRAAELLALLPAEKKLEILAVSTHCKINWESTGNQHAKTYSCTTWPRLSIGKRIRFKDSLFETTDPELQREIETNSSFGVQIRRLAD